MRSGRIGSNMRSSHSFSKAPQVTVPRSRFKRDSAYKTTFNAGDLVPIFIDEALPGDTFKLKLTSFSRLATPLTPFMDNLYLDSFFFSVPCRLIWNNWEKFNGAQTNPGDSTDFLIPQITSTDANPTTGWAPQTLPDYFGLPVGIPGLSVSALPFRAYNLIYNTWFRDENLQNSLTVSLGDGPDSNALYSIRKRNKRYDYFTSSLPNPQKGPVVSLPLGLTAPLVMSGNSPSAVNSSSPLAPFLNVTQFTTSGIGDLNGTNGTITGSAQIDVTRHTLVDLTDATSATINQLRQAEALQEFYEKDARGGTRYVEVLKSHFGVTGEDFRLQRPEYLGGGSTPVVVNPIAQTSSTDSEPSPLANLAAVGTCATHNHGFTKSFVEHCIIIGFVSVRADLNYQQGIDRMWSRKTRADFYWPSFAHLGEQAVLTKEIYAQGNSNDNTVFGYQERYAEYRYKNSLITGQFRSSFAQTLDFWHLAQNFTSLPSLNGTFIQENPPVDRVKALDGTYPDFLFDSIIKLDCTRPMPLYSIPMLGGRL